MFSKTSPLPPSLCTRAYAKGGILYQVDYANNMAQPRNITPFGEILKMV